MRSYDRADINQIHVRLNYFVNGRHVSCAGCSNTSREIAHVYYTADDGSLNKYKFCI